MLISPRRTGSGVGGQFLLPPRVLSARLLYSSQIVSQQLPGVLYDYRGIVTPQSRAIFPSPTPIPSPSSSHWAPPPPPFSPLSALPRLRKIYTELLCTHLSTAKLCHNFCYYSQKILGCRKLKRTLFCFYDN